MLLAPCFRTSVAGVPKNDPPYFCCWISTNSIGAHAIPENAPPRKPEDICSKAVSFLLSPRVKVLLIMPKRGNWIPVSTDMLLRREDDGRGEGRRGMAGYGEIIAQRCNGELTDES